MTIEQIRNAMAHKVGAFPVSFVARTQCRLKGGNPYGLKNAIKTTSGIGFCGAGYAKGIEKQFQKSDLPTNWQVESLPWGEWDVLNVLITHKGQFYLRLYWRLNGSRLPSFKVSDFDGRSIDPNWLTTSTSRKQMDAGIDPVVVRNYKIENLVTITV